MDVRGHRRLKRAIQPVLHEADVSATPTLLWDKRVNVNEQQHRESLLSFGKTAEGAVFFRKSQYESFLPVDEDTMQRIDPFVHILIPKADR